MRASFVIALSLLAACGDDIDGPEPIDPIEEDLLVRLQALPGVTATEIEPGSSATGYRAFALRFTQRVDHDAASGETFQQKVTLIHRDPAAPMVLYTSGYDETLGARTVGLTRLLSANQISVEHRFFGDSMPASRDWSKLTIAQMAADEHAIVELLAPLYQGAWVSTGGSKGGMTAVYHRRFYPDDVVGTVANVAPLSFSIPDPRYAAFLDNAGTAECRDKIRALAIEMLANRRDALLALAQSDAEVNRHAYNRVKIGPSLESAIRDLEFPFWQYWGIDGCELIPAVTDDDATLWDFLQQVSGVGFTDDASNATYEAYFYQAYAQLGSPGQVDMRGDCSPTYLDPYVQYSIEDFRGVLPLDADIPTYDPAPMLDVDRWVQHEASQLIFIYGEWDPWSAGKFRLGDGEDTHLFIQPAGTHGAGIASLEPADRDLVVTRLLAWTGVTIAPPASSTAWKSLAREADEVRRRGPGLP